MNWRTGTPPADKPGWYQVSWYRDPTVWRWWNGRHYSEHASNHVCADVAAYWAKRKMDTHPELNWKPQPRWYARWLIKRGLPVGVTQ